MTAPAHTQPADTQPADTQPAHTQATGTRQIAIVGMGPRGLAVFERLVANASQRPGQPLHVHVFDDTLPGAGAVWRADQSHDLLANTVTSQITMFTDSSVPCAGPIRPGPSMYEWLRAGLGERALAQRPELRSEAAKLGPDDYPTRALYGVYLRWVFDLLIQHRPAHVELSVHRDRVLRLTRGSRDRWRLVMDSSAPVEADAVVLALGHLPAQLGPRETELARFAENHGTTFVAPANPPDADLSTIDAGEPVIIRGLGLCFFDYMALLTTGRGGSFERVAGRLRYQRSGREPILIAGSRRGVPYQARGQNQKGVSQRHTPRFLTEQVVRDLRRRVESGKGVDFMRHVWPLISNEVEFSYVVALLAQRGRQLTSDDETPLIEALSQSAECKRRQLEILGIAESERWDWASVLNPCRNADLSSHASYQAWLLDYLRDDQVQAAEGNLDNPHKCAVDTLRDLRNEVRQVIDHGGILASSYRDHVNGWYTPLNAFLSIGPPMSRIEQLIALIEAGVVHVLGPDFVVDTDPSGVFTAYSPLIPDSRFDARSLIEARLPDARVWNIDDPLLRSLIERGIAREHRLRQGHVEYRTGSIDVTAQPYRVVSADGVTHRSLLAFGVPTEGVHWATAAGVRPGLGSVILTDADAIARHVLPVEAT